MLFNDYFVLELMVLLSVLFYASASNLMTLLYVAGAYLLSVGTLFLLLDGDIYIGFLWVIDLGVGLIFFIFILHFSSFLNQKTIMILSARHFLFSVLFLLLIFLFYYIYPVSNIQTFSSPHVQN